MEILITSKTHKGNAACVGGLILNSNRFVRLLNPGNWDQYPNTDLNIGNIWDIEFVDRQDTEPPHIEDVIIQNRTYLRDIDDISTFIKNSGVTIYNGAPTQIFDGLLRWTSSGSGYIGNKNNLPDNSVGFWISDQDLLLDKDNKHFNSPAPNHLESPKRFPYVGFEQMVELIPRGTLMRISLARWWRPVDSDMPERCYLQLSGWYGLHEHEEGKEEGDLPF